MCDFIIIMFKEHSCQIIEAVQLSICMKNEKICTVARLLKKAAPLEDPQPTTDFAGRQHCQHYGVFANRLTSSI